MVNNLLAITGFVAIVVAWGHYLSLIPPEKVPARPVSHSTGMSVGLMLIITALLRAVDVGDPLALPIMLTLFGAMMVALFFYLMMTASLPDSQLAVRVGDQLPSFQAMDHTGMMVDSAAWGGQRILLKFFRGSW